MEKMVRNLVENIEHDVKMFLLKGRITDAKVVAGTLVGVYATVSASSPNEMINAYLCTDEIPNDEDGISTFVTMVKVRILNRIEA